jgi:SprT protein
MLKEIRDGVENCIVKAEGFFGETIPRPKIEFNLKGRAAGLCSWGPKKKSLRFNTQFCGKNKKRTLNEVVPHEVAHWVQYHKYGTGRDIKPHGREWKFIMIKVFGLSPKVTLKGADTSGMKVRRQNRFTYNCGCMEHHLSATRHNKMMCGKAAYGCTKCGMPLKRSQNVARKSLTIEQL